MTATPRPNPNSQEALREEIITRWQEPALKVVSLPRRTKLILLIGLPLLAVGLCALGYFLTDSSFYLGGGVALAAALYTLSQRRNRARQSVVVSTTRLQVGDRIFPLSELAGFWFETDQGYPVVNIEPKKPSFFPITVLFPGSEQEATQALLQVLPEVEPRRVHASERWSSYFKL